MRALSIQKKNRAERGQAMLLAVLFLVGGSAIVLTGVAGPVLTDVRTTGDFVASRQSFSLAEGGVEDVTYRLIEGMSVSDTEVISEGTVSATTTHAAAAGTREVLAVGDERSAIRKSKIVLQEGSGASFNYGLQSDAGGIHLKNTASIRGSAFSNGPITGENSNMVRGAVISAGPSGLIDGVHATSSAYAHTIRDSEIDGDAHYQVIEGTTVGGTEYPDSDDQATSTLPISDAQIEEWKDAAVSGGTYSGSCPYKINSNESIGPIKIPCDLEIQGSPTVTLTGHIWVEGNIEVQNQAELKVADALSGDSIAIVADDPDDPTSKGVIQLKNSATFSGAGEGSYILFVSQNTSAEEGGGTAAIEVQNTVAGDLLVYAAHGKIDIKNSVELKEVTAYRIEIQNTAEVIYESGLADLLFTAGPSGGYTIVGWGEE